MSFTLLGILNSQAAGGVAYWLATLSGASDETGRGVAVDSSSSVFGFGETESAGSGDRAFLLAKRDASGTIQWQRVLGGAGEDYGQSVAVDSSNNAYVLGYTSSTTPDYTTDILLAKYNSAGTLQWQRNLGGSSSTQGFSITVDSSANVYVTGLTYSTGAGASDVILAKYNSSGTIQWQRSYDDTGDAAAAACDSSGNVYVTSLSFTVAKFNTSGTIQWQRGLGNATGSAITLDSDDNLYAFGTTNTNKFIMAKLPNDGSLTGSYSVGGSSHNYSSAGFSVATSTLTASTSSLTAATSSISADTPSLSNGSASLTSDLVQL